MAFNFGPHDFDCECARCESRRAANRQAWSALSEIERAKQLDVLADQFEEAMMEEVGAGHAEIVGHNDNGRALFRFIEPTNSKRDGG